MKAIINWFKDLFYNATDYAIIIFVVVIVAGVLFWRFDLLFSLKIDKETLKPNPIQISENKDNDKPDSSDSNQNDKDTDISENDNNSDSNSTNPLQNDEVKPDEQEDVGQSTQPIPANDGVEVSFSIPEGSFPGKIADILVDKGLIKDKQTFLDRSMELKLDTKLKSGDFKIKTGTSLDDVIKIIAKQV